MTELLSSLQLMDIEACMTMPLDGLLYLTPSFREAEEHIDDANSIAPVFFLCAAYRAAFIIEFQPLSAEPDRPGRIEIRPIPDHPLKFLSAMLDKLNESGAHIYTDVKYSALSAAEKADELANLQHEVSRAKQLYANSVNLLMSAGLFADQLN